MNSQDSCNCFLPVSLSPLTEPPSTHRKSSAQEAIAELAEACKKNGIRLGLYYSQAQDWHHRGGAAYRG